MKQVLVIHGSARKGNTLAVTELARQELAFGGEVAFSDIFLHDLKLPFCQGCTNCVLRGEQFCPHRETVQDLLRQMEEADALVLTSPTYILTLNAEVKNLLDHYAYLFHRPRFFGKKALVISSTAGAGAGNACRFMSRTLQAWGMNRVHKLPVACMDEVFRATPSQQRKIAKIAGRFRRDLLSDRSHHPTWYQLAIYTAMRFNAFMGRVKQSPDHLFWKERGALGRTYPIKSGLIKSIFAGFMFGMMKLMLANNKTTDGV